MRRQVSIIPLPSEASYATLGAWVAWGAWYSTGTLRLIPILRRGESSEGVKCFLSCCFYYFFVFAMFPERYSSTGTVVYWCWYWYWYWYWYGTLYFSPM